MRPARWSPSACAASPTTPSARLGKRRGARPAWCEHPRPSHPDNLRSVREGLVRTGRPPRRCWCAPQVAPASSRPTSNWRVSCDPVQAQRLTNPDGRHRARPAAVRARPDRAGRVRPPGASAEVIPTTGAARGCPRASRSTKLSLRRWVCPHRPRTRTPTDRTNSTAGPHATSTRRAESRQARRPDTNPEGGKASSSPPSTSPSGPSPQPRHPAAAGPRAAKHQRSARRRPARSELSASAGSSRPHPSQQTTVGGRCNGSAASKTVGEPA
jgi:hypothetical protein